MIKLLLLGAPIVEVDGVAVPIARRKALALLAYLATAGGQQRRDTLATLLWPADDQTTARANLRRALSELTGALGAAIFQADRETIALASASRGAPKTAIWLDADALRDAAQAPTPDTFQRELPRGHPVPGAPTLADGDLTRLAAIADLYRGDFMAGFSLRDSPEFDEWQFFQAEEARQQIAGVLAQLAAAYRDRGDYDRAATQARRLIALNPLDEALHRMLMELLERGGRHSAALRQYDDCRRILSQELGLPPQPETTALYEQIRAGALRDPAGRARPADSAGHAPRSGAPLPPISEAYRRRSDGRALPAPTTPFFGREEELAFIAACLANQDCRLLTLLGSGGIGKTRLALHAARAYADAHAGKPDIPGGLVKTIACVAMHGADELIAAIADTFCVPFYGETAPLEHLIDQLREHDALLVLDNVEQMSGHAELIAALLAGAPGIKLLVTSRERLQLSNEWTLPLAGLPLPEPGEIEEFRRSGAAQIFEHSARRVQPGFAWTPDTIAAAGRICALLEGIPLAIELAGGWVRALSPQEIAAEIERCLGFLTSSLRDLPERHRSLRAVFDRSWQLLPAAEQAVFRKLAVFRNGFSHQAAAAVADADLASLAAFLDKSLLRRHPDRGPARGRYEMHEFIRQYAEEQLDPAEHAQASARHHAFYAALLRDHGARPARGNETPASGSPAARLVAEEAENIREAWRWALGGGDLALAEAYSTDLFHFYNDHGWYLEAREVFGQAIAALRAPTGGSPPNDRLLGKLHTYQGNSSLYLGFYSEARMLVKTGVKLLRMIADTPDGDAEALAKALDNLGFLEVSVGRYAEAKEALRESLAMCRLHAIPTIESKALNLLGYIAGNEGDFAQAKSMLEASIAINRRGGYFRQLGHVLNSLGYVLMIAGDYEQAQQRFDESLDLLQRYGTPSGDVVVLINKGFLAIKRGQPALARSLFLTVLQTILPIQAVPLALDTFAGMALLAFEQGDYARSRELLRLPLSHPASWQETRQVAEELRANLRARHYPPEYQGPSPEWQAVAAALLAAPASGSPVAAEAPADLAPFA